MRQRKHGRRRSQEGAAMLVVMLVILVVTASGMFAIHSAAFEVRASGNERVATQAYYVADVGMSQAHAWVDNRGPGTLLRLIRAAEEEPLDLAPFEPKMADQRGAYRLDGVDLANLGGDPLTQEQLGPRQVYEPRFLIDVYDVHLHTGIQAGHRSDGNGQMHYLRATYTSRGRLGVARGDFQDERNVREYHEAARDMRSEALSGPFGGGI